ncbi:unnamed protein product, partial [Prunus brigantina]
SLSLTRSISSTVSLPRVPLSLRRQSSFSLNSGCLRSLFLSQRFISPPSLHDHHHSVSPTL